MRAPNLLRLHLAKLSGGLARTIGSTSGQFVEEAVGSTPALLTHGLGAVQGLTQDVGVPSMLGGLGDQMEQHPAR